MYVPYRGKCITGNCPQEYVDSTVHHGGGWYPPSIQKDRKKTEHDRKRTEKGQKKTEKDRKKTERNKERQKKDRKLDQKGQTGGGLARKFFQGRKTEERRRNRRKDRKLDQRDRNWPKWRVAVAVAAIQSRDLANNTIFLTKK